MSAFRFIIMACIALVAGGDRGLAGAHKPQQPDRTTLVWGSFRDRASLQPGDQRNLKFEIFAKHSQEMIKTGPRGGLWLYGQFAVVKDSAGFDYNNKGQAGLGFEIKFPIGAFAKLSFGTRLGTEQSQYSGQFYSAPVATVDFSLYRRWTFKHFGLAGPEGSALILSGWSKLRYPGSLDPFERKNLLAQGAYKLSLAIPLRKNKLAISPFASVGFTADTKGRSWNNKLEPAVGLAVNLPLGPHGELALGAKFGEEYRFRASTRRRGSTLYVSWYRNF
jgi:hypothetical protein